MNGHRFPIVLALGTVLLVLLVTIACAKATPTPTPQPTATPSPTVVGSTPTASPVPTATSTPAKAGLPDPKNPPGVITFAGYEVYPGVGLPASMSSEQFKQFGVAEGMFRRDEQPDGTWEAVSPWLVKSYDLAPDLSKVTLHLQEGVQFHKGWGEMTAEDVVWSVNSENGGVNPESIHTQAGDLANLFKAWTVVDTYTVEAPFNNFDVRWATYFLNYFGEPVDVFSKKACEENGDDWCRDNVVATGPFEVEEWIADDHAYLKRVPDHWYMTAKAEEMNVLEVPESGTRLSMLQTGQVDIAYAPIKDVAQLQGDGYEAWTNNLAFQLGVFFSGNLWETENAKTGAPLDTSAVYARPYAWIGDPKSDADMEEARNVRWALAMAVDRELINESVVGGLGWPVYIEYLSPKFERWQDKWNIPYDPEQAKRLLDENNYPNGFEIPLFVGPEVGGAKGVCGEIGDAVGGMWASIGLDTQVLKYAYNVHRPGLVTRTTTIPMLTSADEGKGPFPWDWPKGAVMSSLTRGGYSAGLESPWIAENYLKMAGETDINKRYEMADEFADYITHWRLDFGVVAVPDYFAYNPKAISDWKQVPLGHSNYNGLEWVTPTSR